MEKKKDKYKILIGLIAGILFSGSIVYAAGTSILGASNGVTYNNSYSGLTSTNVKGALDEVNIMQDKPCPDNYDCYVTCPIHYDNLNQLTIAHFSNDYPVYKTISITYNSSTKVNQIYLTSISGWEHLYNQFYADVGKKYTITFEYSVPTSFSGNTGYGAIKYSILSSEPTNDSSMDQTVTAGFISGTAVSTYRTAKLSFTPSSSGTYYFDFNFGHVNDVYTNLNVLNVKNLTMYVEGIKSTSTDICNTTGINPGDYISYTPSSTSFTTDKAMTGYTSNQTFNPSELNLWRVLSINDDGSVDIISEYVSSANIYFKGQVGYQNIVGYLNYIASQYENPRYTIGSRYFGYNGQTRYITDTSKFVNPAPWTCSTGANGCSTVESQGGGDTLYTTDFNLVNTVLGTRVAYKVGTTTVTYYWMASRYYDYISAAYYYWYGRHVSTTGSLSGSSLYYYNSGSFYLNIDSNALRPIVILKPGLNYTGSGTSSDPWRLS